MTHLLSLTLNPRNRSAARDLGNSVEMHRTVMKLGLGGEDVQAAEPRSASSLLFRVSRHGDRAEVLVQGSHEMDAGVLDEGYCTEVRSLDLATVMDRLNPGGQVRYSAVIAPVRNMGSGVHGQRGAKHPLKNPEEVQEWWLAREARFGLRTAQVGDIPQMRVQRDLATSSGARRKPDGKRQQIKHRGFRVTGLGSIENLDLLLSTLRGGIGPGKAYGYGLLTVVPR